MINEKPLKSKLNEVRRRGNMATENEKQVFRRCS